MVFLIELYKKTQNKILKQIIIFFKKRSIFLLSFKKNHLFYFLGI